MKDDPIISPPLTYSNVKPLNSAELLEMAVSGTPVPLYRALATFAERSNWVQLYDGKTSPGEDYPPKACEWAFIGPMRPPWELAQHGLQSASTPQLLNRLREIEEAFMSNGYVQCADILHTAIEQVESLTLKS